jgi:DnaK suppressor protein
VSDGLAAVERRLRRERAEVADELGERRRDLTRSLDGQIDDSGDDSRLADGGAETFERELAATLSDNAQDLLARYDAALERLRDGRFGTCTRCGGAIESERLEALPYVELCMGCARLESR